MPLNVPGILVPFHLLINPRLVIPGLLEDIRQIDFAALKRAGYRGAVFDKDNCLTIPHKDTLVPELQESWQECREAFGEGNVLIVSNSAGTYLDAGGMQTESVTHHLGVPVLQHRAFKPAYSCITAVRTYFSSLRAPIADHELVIVGDRIFTDIVMANRMYSRRKRSVLGDPASPAVEKGTEQTVLGSQGPLAIWTTGVWQRESMLMRWLERQLVNSVEKWSTAPPGEPVDVRAFVKELPRVEPPKKSSRIWLDGLISLFRRA
ncbi:hypothetical protein HYPSUDRAFT_211438 [Hypholoma sublateritium FD-334 SS-4]|uniref:Uncharacterized protein n=1 Tax=Hypholoma sublateritium (strain FD-334 SS-4) TaxID=945553 RepID=A0A0D2PD71_HYPSF|nr:hypothetical protein HYPSUDRAFT_211438 [Hypholoma sublateritium FD-334 SS-4]